MPFHVYDRHRKQRGEISLTVGSTETLRDVKLQVIFNNPFEDFRCHLES